MFARISEKIPYPDWVKRDSRWKRFDIYDRLLNGTFYDHIKWSFYDEADPARPLELIKIEDRRPSAQFRLPRMVGRWCSRKLFAGRHAPRVRHPDKEIKKAINGLIKKIRLYEHMQNIVVKGSVGSVAATFRCSENRDNAEITIWPAKYCTPQFDSMGELQILRINYITSGADIIDQNIAGDYDPKESYWMVRDIFPDLEVTYVPVKKDDWNPVDGFKEGISFIELENETYTHELGFVPAHWFKNLSGGDGIDGACTWEDAIPNSIEIDYQLSQCGRGVRYNGAPQLVIKGELLTEGPNDPITRGPQVALFLAGDRKDAEGNTEGGADAKLLEMSGRGTESAMKYIEMLRNLALECIAMSRKDPEKAKGPMSGRAMEYMDDDSHDMVMELRTSYGEHGVLPLLRKIMKAMEPEFDSSAVSLQWPRLFQPTTADILVMMQAFQIAIDPLDVAMNDPPPVPVAGAAPVKGKPKAKPKAPKQGDGPPEDFQFMSIDEIRAFIRTNLDLNLLDIDEDNDDDIEPPDANNGGGDDITKPPNPDPSLGEGDGSLTIATTLFGTKIGSPVRVNS